MLETDTEILLLKQWEIALMQLNNEGEFPVRYMCQILHLQTQQEEGMAPDADCLVLTRMKEPVVCQTY